MPFSQISSEIPIKKVSVNDFSSLDHDPVTGTIRLESQGRRISLKTLKKRISEDKDSQSLMDEIANEEIELYLQYEIMAKQLHYVLQKDDLEDVIACDQLPVDFQILSQEVRDAVIKTALQKMVKVHQKTEKIGSTCHVAVVTGNTVTTAHLGDSYIFIVTVDKKGNVTLDRSNTTLHSAQPRLISRDGLRAISVGRGIGNADVPDFSHKPDFYHHTVKIPDEGKAFVLATCDGVFEKLTEAELKKIIKDWYVMEEFYEVKSQELSYAELAVEIQSAAYNRRSFDNISIAITPIQTNTLPKVLVLADGHGGKAVAEDIGKKLIPFLATEGIKHTSEYVLQVVIRDDNHSENDKFFSEYRRGITVFGKTGKEDDSMDSLSELLNENIKEHSLISREKQIHWIKKNSTANNNPVIQILLLTMWNYLDTQNIVPGNLNSKEAHQYCKIILKDNLPVFRSEKTYNTFDSKVVIKSYSYGKIFVENVGEPHIQDGNLYTVITSTVTVPDELKGIFKDLPSYKIILDKKEGELIGSPKYTLVDQASRNKKLISRYGNASSGVRLKQWATVAVLAIAGAVGGFFAGFALGGVAAIPFALMGGVLGVTAAMAWNASIMDKAAEKNDALKKVIEKGNHCTIVTVDEAQRALSSSAVIRAGLGKGRQLEVAAQSAVPVDSLPNQVPESVSAIDDEKYSEDSSNNSPRFRSH